MTAEIPKIVQQMGSGTESNIEVMGTGAVASFPVATRMGALGPGGAGTVRSGWVRAILTVGVAGGGAGSGRMVIRAVSLRGPA